MPKVYDCGAYDKGEGRPPDKGIHGRSMRRERGMQAGIGSSLPATQVV
jgi:hypothetical protein